MAAKMVWSSVHERCEMAKQRRTCAMPQVFLFDGPPLNLQDCVEK